MDYLCWNDSLAERFFRPECDGQRVFLFVTESLIAEIGATSDEALSEFVRSVLAGPPFVYGETLCDRASRSLFNWRRGGRKWPPYLGYLALFVLAAGLDGEFSPNAYYPRLKKLLGEPPLPGMYPGFDRMHRLWEDLEAWSIRDQHGALGVFRFQLPSRLVHVGIPISQVILNERERLLLPELFSEAGLAGTSAPSEFFMSHCLIRYGPGKLRPRTINVLRRELGTADESELIVSVALDEFDTWDGTYSRQESAVGEKRGALRLCLTDIDDIGGRLKARFRCRAQRDFPDGTVELANKNTRFTCEKETENWSTVLADPDSLEEVDASQFDWSEKLDIVDTGNGLHFQMPGSPAKIFGSGAEEDLNGYFEIQNLPQEQQVFVAAQDSAAADIESWGNRSCEGFKEVSIERGLPRAWRLFKVERVLDDRWIRHKYTQFSLAQEAQVFVKGGIRDRSGAYFPFALPAIDILGASSTSSLVINGNQRITGDQGNYQLDIGDIESLQIRIELQEGGRTLRTRNLYIRSDEQPFDHAPCWVDRCGRRIGLATSPRICGSEIICGEIPPFSDWLEDFANKDDAGAEHQDDVEWADDSEDEVAFRSRARTLLREWKTEINGPVATTYRSRLARLPMGDRLTEGALQYKRAFLTGSEREYARAIRELSQALASEETVVRMVAYIFLALIAFRTNRRQPLLPKLPEYARAEVENVFHPIPGPNTKERLSLNEISPVEGEESVSHA